MWRLALLGMILALCGCGGSADDKIVGEWRGEIPVGNGKVLQGANLTFDADHHFRELFKNLEVTGSWSFTGNELTFTTERVGGMSVPDYQKKLLALAQQKKSDSFRQMAEGLDKPAVFVLSSDSRSMTAKGGGNTVYKKQSP
jgi:hypothetical protein